MIAKIKYLFSKIKSFLKRDKYDKYVLICMRQVDTWRWTSNLGEKTSGECFKCKAPIFFEKQNTRFSKKICHVCAYSRDS